MEIVRLSGAHTFVIENVRQLIGTTEHAAIVETAEDLGFRVASGVLLAANYGVPQMRFRAFIIGNRFVDPAPFFPPKKTHFDPRSSKPIDLLEYIDAPQAYRTVRDVISELPEPEGTDIRKQPSPLNLHFGRQPTSLSMRRYQTIPDEGMNRFDLQRRAPELTPDCWIRKTKGGTDLFGRLWWDRPAFTIRTEFFKPEKGRYLHPTQHRPITHREAARIQSFPDDFIFCGKKIDIARQIGNAVPPLLAWHVAGVVRLVIESVEMKELAVA
jgi:DNA (cytosine-5)-methyltransferase 1